MRQQKHGLTVLSLRLALEVREHSALPVRILLLFLFLAVPPAAIADGQTWDVSGLMHRFSGIVHAKLVFRETRNSAFIVTDLVTTGSIEYRRPDYIEKNVVSPIAEKIVIAGDYVSIEKVVHQRKGEDVVQIQKYPVQSHPVLATAVASLRAILDGDETLIRQDFEIELEGSRADWQLNLIPDNPEILKYFDRITLHGSDARIRKIVSVLADGDQSMLELTYQLLQPTNP